MMTEEGRFPGHRDPRSLDSRYVSAPPDPASLRAFKKSLPLSGRPSHFVGGSGRPVEEHQQIQNNTTSSNAVPDGSTVSGQYPLQRALDHNCQQPELLYPVAMFSDFPELPSAETLCTLLDMFASRFLPNAPFIAGLDIGLTSEFQRDKTPPFLTFAMAVLGALVSGDHDLIKWGPNLWQAASHVHSASCEVDNRVARKVDWVTSFIFLETYGIMHADGERWSQTNIWNRHVDTGSKRQGLNNLFTELGSHKIHSTTRPRASGQAKIMGLYFLVDLLRALQLNAPPSFHAFDLSLPLSHGLSFRQLYEDVILNSKSVPAGLEWDDYFLLLLAILSEIMALQRGIGPLFDFSNCHGTRFAHSNVSARSVVHHYSGISSASQSQPQPFAGCIDHEQSTLHATSYNNPFLTLSASAEYARISCLLGHALDEWSNVCLSHIEDRYVPKVLGSTDSRILFSVLTLFHFCRLLLSGGPRLLSIIGVVGYSPEKWFKAPTNIPATQIPDISEESLAHAWHILESVEEQKESPLPSNSKLDIPRALWSPIVVFYAGLTVWASLQAPVSFQEGRGGLRMKKMLRLFEMELREMNWPCTPVMADILQDLRNK